MSKRLDYEHVNRQRRVEFYPSQRSRPATQKQLDYIQGLAVKKGQPAPRLPRTMQGASNMIDRLLALPDVESKYIEPRVEVPVVQKPSDRQEMAAELRQRFPQLSPMTAISMVQVFEPLDPLGTALTFDEVMQEKTPDDQDELIVFILRRFLENFSEVSDDDGELAA